MVAPVLDRGPWGARSGRFVRWLDAWLGIISSSVVQSDQDQAPPEIGDPKICHLANRRPEGEFSPSCSRLACAGFERGELPKVDKPARGYSQVSARTVARPKRPPPALIGRRDSS